jgi:hypothetical protein
MMKTAILVIDMVKDNPELSSHPLLAVMRARELPGEG